MRRWMIAGLLGALALGCAKQPSGGSGTTFTRVLITLRVNREINPNYVYLVGLNPSKEVNPTVQGPVPVITPPWGNGFLAGNATHFVRWDPLQSPEFLLYKFRDANLIEYFLVGTPVSFQEVSPGTQQLQFELDLSQIAPTVAETNQLVSLQLNFFTMDRVPQGATGSKVWDALGNSLLPSEINEYITIPLTGSGVYTNNSFLDLEPRGDVADPDLDLIDWTVEVRRQGA